MFPYCTHLKNYNSQQLVLLKKERLFHLNVDKINLIYINLFCLLSYQNHHHLLTIYFLIKTFHFHLLIPFLFFKHFKTSHLNPCQNHHILLFKYNHLYVILIFELKHNCSDNKSHFKILFI